MSLTIIDHLREARRRLEAAGIEPVEAALDADVLARYALGGWERGELLARQRDAAPRDFADAFGPLVTRREAREPAAYIIGIREFWNLDIDVTCDTLVPRPETELLVEEALDRLSGMSRVRGTGDPDVRIADVCTGSGCIAVALARWLPRVRVVATDISAAALAVARRNASKHAVADRVTFVETNLLESVDGPFDVIVANPPYVPTRELAEAAPEVRVYEPSGALDGGADGLDLVRRLVPQAAARLAPDGELMMEFGFGEADAVRAVVAAEPRLTLESIRDDYAGIPRVAIARSRASGH